METRALNALLSLNKRDGLLFALIFVALLARLSLSAPIWHHGEAREGLVVQNIVREHHWILPFRNGELPSKPPLFHWLASLPALFVGANDFIVRLPSVLAALVMAFTVFSLGRAMGGRITAWLAVGTLLGMYEFWNSATQARVDMVFSACITVSAAGFFFWHRDRSQIARTFCYLACACAVLAKGPVGIALPVLIIGGFLAIERDSRALRTLWFWPLAGIVLLIDLGWYGAAYAIGGDEFLRLHLWLENFDRFIGRGSFASQNTTLSTAVWLANQTFPWNLALPWSLLKFLRGERGDWTGRFLHVWWLSIFGFFALAARSRAVYLLPLCPAIALVAARGMSAMISKIEGAYSFGTLNESSSVSTTARPSRKIVKRLGICIVLVDVGLMLAIPRFWQDSRLINARVEFIEKIRSLVRTNGALFVTPEFDTSETIVIAYRLGRPIGHKPLACARPSDYFLVPLEETDIPRGETRVLASSSFAKWALVAVNVKDPSLRSAPTAPPDCPAPVAQDIVQRGEWLFSLTTFLIPGISSSHGR